MTSEEKAKKIEEIYSEAMKKLAELGKKREDIIHSYVRGLEEQKIKAVRDSLNDKFSK
jgi:phosphosulfolactate synthase (CoM biosynthesis protein A)